MFSRTRAATLSLTSLLFLAACTALPVHQALPDGAREKISSTDVIAPIRQSEIYVYVPPSTAGSTAGAGFGLVGVLVGVAIDASVDSVRTGKAETAVKPLRDALVDYDFDNELKDSLKASLSGLVWMGAADPQVIKQVTDENDDRSLSASKAGAVLFLTTDYHLANDGDILTITSQADLFPNSDALRVLQKSPKRAPLTAAQNAIFRDTLTFETKVPTPAGDRDKDIAIWSADHGAVMRSALKLGTTKIATLLAMDLLQPAADPPGNGSIVKFDGQEGTVLATDDVGDTVRQKDGGLWFVTRSMLDSGN